MSLLIHTDQLKHIATFFKLANKDFDCPGAQSSDVRNLSNMFCLVPLSFHPFGLASKEDFVIANFYVRKFFFNLTKRLAPQEGEFF